MIFQCSLIRRLQTKTEKLAPIAERVPDGACLQLGIGGVANAVSELLVNKKDLGVHTEMFVDSMVTLAKKGVINCSKKNFHPGKITAGFGIGSKELYDFMDRNQLMKPSLFGRSRTLI